MINMIPQILILQFADDDKRTNAVLVFPKILPLKKIPATKKKINKS